MITITKPQAQKRFLIIPEVLQNALFSVQTAAIIDQICNDNHLDEKRASVVVESVGWILLGFLHPEDIKKELANAGVPAPAAQDILSSLDAKIFAALDPALLKAYAPLPHEEPLSQSQPTMVKDINPLPMPTPPKPAPLSSVGWSKMPPSAIAPAPMPTAPRPIAPPAPIPAPTRTGRSHSSRGRRTRADDPSRGHFIQGGGEKRFLHACAPERRSGHAYEPSACCLGSHAAGGAGVRRNKAAVPHP